MRQRGGSEQPVKGRRANRPKARKVSIAAPSVADLQKQVGILTRERDDALEQQRAAAEVLKIISASPTELRPVLEVIVKSAARFCDADDVTIFELDGQDLRTAAHRGRSRRRSAFVSRARMEVFRAAPLSIERRFM